MAPAPAPPGMSHTGRRCRSHCRIPPGTPHTPGQMVEETLANISLGTNTRRPAFWANKNTFIAFLDSFR